MAKFLFYDDKIINILLKDEKPSGGAAIQAYGWIKGLSESNQDVQIITKINYNEILKEECKDISIIPMYDHEKGIRWLRWVYYRIPYIYKSLKKTKADYLYQCVPGWQSFLIGVICYILHIKYILRISNDYLLDERFYHKRSRVHHFFLRLGIRLSYCVLCQNEYQYNIIKNRFPTKKTMKISNPILLETAYSNMNIYDRKYIAWVGVFQYQKNLKLLYEISSELKNETFLIAGKEMSKLDDETIYYLNKLKHLPNVKFVGFLQRDQVLPFLSKAKFLLNTSHYEGFSNTFLEAMMVKTPIITSRKVNPDSIISKYNLGLVYTDTTDLNEQYLSITQESYQTMTNNVLDYVLENHEYKTLTKRIVNFLNSN